MQVYQVDASVSANGVINLPMMPYLYNKKVKLVIIPTEDKSMDSKQRKRAMDRILKRQDTMQASRWTDEELDNLRYEYLKEKHQ
ncbi:MAG: hypothetical protein FWD60_12695 [Candidatus Azobacteroides sp.]|nr:hypothetical protein [Candidatus Azobacteroides sp.]